MNYNFEFNSPTIGKKIQAFEYSNAITNEYVFTYGRDIFSDLSKFNSQARDATALRVLPGNRLAQSRPSRG